MIIIKTTPNKFTINTYVASIYKDGEEIKSKTNRFGDYLVFMDGMKYYCKPVNKNKMIFGELLYPGVISGEKKWEYEFTRLKEA